VRVGERRERPLQDGVAERRQQVELRGAGPLAARADGVERPRRALDVVSRRRA